MHLQINLNVSKDEANVGDEITLKVDTKSGSFVSILGVDQAVANLGSRNEINEANVMESLQNLIPGLLASNLSTFNQLKKINAFSLKPLHDCSVDVDAIMATIPDGLVDQSASIDYEDDVIYDVKSLAVDQGITITTLPPPYYTSIEGDKDFEEKIREYFPDIWIYDDFNAITSKTERKYKAADSMTSWKISGISIHPEHGIAIATPKFITIIKDNYLTVSATNIARVGEVIVIILSAVSKQKSDKAEVEIVKNKENSVDYEFVKEVQPFRNGTTAFRKTEIPSTFDIKSNSVQLLLQPSTAGIISLNFKLKIEGVSKDEIKVNVKVLHDGIVFENNTQILIDLRNENSQDISANLALPPKSKLLKAELMLSGNLLGPAIESLNEM